MVARLRFAASAAALIVACAPATSLAQIDYRNLDDDRPTLVEDAYAIERYAFEFLLPHTISTARGGLRTHATVLELAYGIASGAHVGLKLPIAGAPDGTDRIWGLAGLRGFLLYNANTEGPVLPALSVRFDGFLPAGSLGGDVARGEAKLIATRSFGRQRLHVNAAIGLGPDGVAPAAEGAARWWYGAAVDRVFIRNSLLIIGEVYARRDARDEPVEVNAGLGFRWQLAPTLVFDAGLSRRLRATGPDLAVTFGVSHAFAIAGLLPRAPHSPPATGGSDAHRH